MTATDNVVELSAEKNRELLVEAGDKYFDGARTQEELFALLRLALQELSNLFQELNRRGALQLEDVAVYQWSSTLTATIIRVLEIGPMYDSDALETQLKQNLRQILKGAPVRPFKS